MRINTNHSSKKPQITDNQYIKFVLIRVIRG